MSTTQQRFEAALSVLEDSREWLTIAEQEAFDTLRELWAGRFHPVQGPLSPPAFFVWQSPGTEKTG